MTESTPMGPGGPDNGRYRCDSRIATGGMGEVWRATDQVLGREVAIKVLKNEYSDDPTFRSRFETEARNAAALHHPNVASVFDFGELPAGESGTPRPYLVMELVRGEPLSALLRGGERMPAETAADLIAQAADGIAAAHDLGIVHRDVKPANLLVTPERTVKITDFGIARAADAVALTQTGQVIGTPQYLSPEQAEGKQATGASDIYSLGVVLYECLAGQRPFDADSPIATALAHLREDPPPLPEDVPSWLRDTVETALTKDPAARFASVRDLASALRGGPVQGGTPIPAPGVDAPTRVQTRPGGVPVAGAAGAAAVGAGAVAAGSDADAATRGSGEAWADKRDAAWAADSSARTRGGGDDGELGPPPGSGQGRPRRRVPAWLPWVAAAIAVLVIVVLLTRLSGDNNGDTATDQGTDSASPSAKTSKEPTQAASSEAPSQAPSESASESASETPAPSKSESASPEQVQVDEGDFVGRPKDEARKDLEGLGLEVAERKVDNPGEEDKDTVSDVSPSGQVDPGSTVTLSFYGDPLPVETPTATGGDPEKKDKGSGKGKG